MIFYAYTIVTSMLYLHNVICCKIWAKCKLGGMYTLSFTNSQKQKSSDVRLGDLGGSGMLLPQPIHLPGKVYFRYHVTSPVIMGKGPIL